VNTRLKNRLRSYQAKRNLAVELIDKSGYAILAFIALWASAMLTSFSVQFLCLSMLLGLKWVFGSQKQVIQILMSEKGGDKDDRGCEIA